MRLKSILNTVAIALVGGAMTCTSIVRAADPQPKEADVKKVIAALPAEAPAKPKQARKVLVFGHAGGYVHGSIPLGCQMVVEMGKKTGAWEGTISYDPAVFTPENLKQYDAIALVSCTGMFLDDKSADPSPRRQALEDFVKEGKGLWGCHGTGDAYHVNQEYRYDYDDMIGASFSEHPVGKVHLLVDDPKSPLTSMWDSAGFDYSDEIYMFGDKGKNKDGTDKQTYSRTKLHVLLSVDPSQIPGQMKGKRADNDFGYAWIRKYGKGRVFYTGMGHGEDRYWDPKVQKFMLAGMQYALGDLEADDSPSGPKAETAPAAAAPK